MDLGDLFSSAVVDRARCKEACERLKEKIRYEIDVLHNILRERELDLYIEIEKEFSDQVHKIDQDVRATCVEKIMTIHGENKRSACKRCLVFNSDLEELKRRLKNFGHFRYEDTKEHAEKGDQEFLGIPKRSFPVSVQAKDAQLPMSTRKLFELNSLYPTRIKHSAPLPSASALRENSLAECRNANKLSAPQMSISGHHVTQNPVQQNSPAIVSVAPSARVPASAADIEKRQLNQLQLILHVQKCQVFENQSGGEAKQCSLANCKAMKHVLNHLSTCEAGMYCDMPLCSSSRQIMSHFKDCTRSDCPLCLPSKQAFDGRQKQAVNEPTWQSAENHFSASQCARLNRLFQVQPRPLILDGIAGSTFKAVANSLTMDDNFQSQVKASNAAILRSTPPSVFGVIPETPIISKDWHQLVTQDVRRKTIRKIALALFPPIAVLDFPDEIMKELAAAAKIEVDLYETANNKDEYKELIYIKISKLEDEQKRKEMEKQMGPELDLILSNNSTCVSRRLPRPYWVPTGIPVAPSPIHLSPPPFLNGGKRSFDILSSYGSKSSNCMNANNQSQFNQAQAWQNSTPCVSLQLQQLLQSHAPATTASASADSSATASTVEVLKEDEGDSSDKADSTSPKEDEADICNSSDSVSNKEEEEIIVDGSNPVSKMEDEEDKSDGEDSCSSWDIIDYPQC